MEEKQIDGKRRTYHIKGMMQLEEVLKKNQYLILNDEWTKIFATYSDKSCIIGQFYADGKTCVEIHMHYPCNILDNMGDWTKPKNPNCVNVKIKEYNKCAREYRRVIEMVQWIKGSKDITSINNNIAFELMVMYRDKFFDVGRKDYQQRQIIKKGNKNDK